MKEFIGYKHGINFGGWFSQCDNSEQRYNSFISEADFETVSKWGLDHIRIPIDYELVLNDDDTFKQSGFGRIRNCIELCKKYGLNMILDLHKTKGFSFDYKENENGFFEDRYFQDLFCKLWAQLARDFGHYDNLAFELLNEVTDESYIDVWNEVSIRAIQMIRDFAPTIKILVGSYHNNSVSAVRKLALPYDSNIVYNFHCYEPLAFTHQGAYWIPTMDTSFRMKFEEPYSVYRENTKKIGERYMYNLPESEDVIDEKFFEMIFADALKVCEERNVAIYCGEYGVIDLAEPEDTLKWYRCINKVFEKYNIGRAAWTYKEMDFGLVGKHYDSVRDELIKLL